jgi:hypothetical protein
MYLRESGWHPTRLRLAADGRVDPGDGAAPTEHLRRQ